MRHMPGELFDPSQVSLLTDQICADVSRCRVANRAESEDFIIAHVLELKVRPDRGGWARRFDIRARGLRRA